MKGFRKRLRAVNPPILGIPRELPPKTVRQVRTFDDKSKWGAIASADLPGRFKSELSQPFNDGGPGGLINDTAAYDLWNDYGVLCLIIPGVVDSYPMSPAGLPPGALWNNGDVVCIAGWSVLVPGATLTVFFGQITALQLLAMGGASLPLSPSTINQLYNDKGVVCVGGIYS